MTPSPPTVPQRHHRRGLRRRGALIYLVAALIVLLMAAVAFSVDVAYMQLVRTQLRSANDLAARAGAEALDRTNNADTARAAIKSVALANKVAGTGLNITDSQITFGKTSVSGGVATFTANSTPYNSVRVQGTRTGSGTNGSVNLFFGNLFGRGNFSPQTAATVTIEAPKKRDIVLVLDRSGSMEDPVTWGSRTSKWEDAVAAVGYFIEAINATVDDTERVGVASYSDNATVDRSMTTNYSRVTSKVNNLDTGGATNIGDGIEKGMTVMLGARTDLDIEKIIVVLTDGTWNRGYNPVGAATTAKLLGYKVITITFGDDCDQEAMEDVATAGNGRHYHAPSRTELIDIFSQIGLGIDGLQYIE